MRIDKFLSNSGIGTRSEIKNEIKKGNILINKIRVKSPKEEVDIEKDEVLFNGDKITYKKYIYIMMNKPKGYISANKDNKHKVVLDLLSDYEKSFDPFVVGRLDIDTEGLLLLTNDGQFSHNLLSPSKHVDKTYYVELENELDEKDVYTLEQGVDIGGYITKEAKVNIIDNKKCYIIIHEGKFHQVKKMFNTVKNKVVFLKRVKIGNLELDSKLMLGEYRELTEEEVNLLKK